MGRLAAAVCLCSVLSGAATANSLDIYFIDVEGGQSTLIVTPAGQTLLIDAGYGARGGRDPERIMAAARDAGISRIDYLLITHFHNDHVGGVPELSALIPIGTFIDYDTPLGTDRLATNAFRAYEPVRARGAHLVPKPGSRLPLTGLVVDVVSAGGEVPSKPLKGAGGKTGGCATIEPQVEDGTENYRSVGVRIAFGKFRFLDIGDLSGPTLVNLFCPKNLVGEVSAYLVAHHGNYDTNLAPIYGTLRPQVAIVNNGVKKGGDPAALTTLRRQPGLVPWQLHWSQNEGAQNPDEKFIANVDDGQTGYWLKLSAGRDGSFTVTNARNGFSMRYAGR